MTDREYNGIPIKGDYTPNSIFEKEQLPFTEVLPLLEKALALPGVKRVEWSQATPYFNDGDACVFGCYPSAFVVDHNGEEREFGEYVDYSFEDYEPGWRYEDNRNLSWQERQAHTTTTIDGVDYSQHYALQREIDSAFEGGSYDRDLLKIFGDHASISFDGSGFNVEFYEHD